MFLGAWRVRRRLRRGPEAAAALGLGAVRALVRALRDLDLHRAAARALIQLGAACRPALLAELSRRGAPTRRILDVLGRLRPAADPGPLLDYLHDPRPQVRRTAARSVHRQGGPLAHRALAAMLVDPDDEMRAIAVAHFSRSTDPRSVKPLAMAVAYGGEFAGRFAAARIAELGALAVAPLLDALRSQDEPLRASIGKLLEAFDDPAAIVILCKGLEEDDPRISRPVFEALGRKPFAVAPYVQHLGGHPDARVRELAARLQAHWGAEASAAGPGAVASERGPLPAGQA